MCHFLEFERLLLNHEKTPEFLASGGEEFNPRPEARLDAQCFCVIKFFFFFFLKFYLFACAGS